MQKIVHQTGYKSVHPIFDDIESFYQITSTKTVYNTNSLIKPSYDYCFEYLYSLFEKYGGKEYDKYDITFTNKQYKPIPLKQYDPNNLIMMFSGGKDSTAAVLHYKEQGYNIYLYHLLGINKQYPDEWKRAKEVADYLELPIYFDEIKFEGKNEFPEHPMKNIIIANGALQYGINNNITTKIANGNYYMTDLEEASFHISGSDSILMYLAYEDIIQSIIPEFKMYIGLENMNDTYEILLKHPELMKMCQSCMGAHRFREWNKKRIETKYNIKLLPNRCGCCWKCAKEYIYMTDNDLMEYNEDYYKFCLQVLKKNLKEEHGVIVENIKDLWHNEFVYDIEKSKYKDILNYK